MTYQVLARKWRPRRFEDMVGQEHVLRALTSALDEGRLHHAYLFSGTRGVGKTTVARIFAKALNCERGVSSHPCGECMACRSIDEGRFVDLIEVDAASRTGVDDTRELLDNVQYAPSAGRYKVYLIDEVHMFSKSSFNALLKTLEEPPPHVKFLLATTDPQKLPVTVLSRCLHFHLKALSRRMIHDRLANVLKAENIAFDDGALQLLARAADGSLRDALSLLDQAIAYGQGRVSEEEVSAMLGLTSEARIRALMEALIAQDPPALFDAIGQLAQGAPDYAEVLAELLGLLHAIAVYQLMPEADAELFEASPTLVREFAPRLAPDAVQLYYQIALHGRRDLPLAPSARMALEMTLLRMLAFVPVDTGVNNAEGNGVGTRAHASFAVNVTQRVASRDGVRNLPVGEAVARRVVSQPSPPGRRESFAEPVSAASLGPEPPTDAPRSEPARPAVARSESMSAGGQILDGLTPQELLPERVEGTSIRKPLDAGAWHRLLPRLELKGMALMLAENSELVGQNGPQISLRCPPSHASLRTPLAEESIRKALSKVLGMEVRLRYEEGRPVQNTPAQVRKQQEETRQLGAVESLRNDPVVRKLEERLDARLVEESVRPLDSG
ncbi:MAG: DNA polymerase III subunit gamma/tau [Gammaproteobacteria bacterium]|nr:DNA polymerase III subunit gamma/tau [Gammaproteobacteria bacterium]